MDVEVLKFYDFQSCTVQLLKHLASGTSSKFSQSMYCWLYSFSPIYMFLLLFALYRLHLSKHPTVGYEGNSIPIYPHSANEKSKAYWGLGEVGVPPTYSWALVITEPFAGRDSQSHVGDSQRENERPHAIIYQPDLPAGQGSQTLKYRGSDKNRDFSSLTPPPPHDAEPMLFCWVSGVLAASAVCRGLQVIALCLGMRFIKAPTPPKSPPPHAESRLDGEWRRKGTLPRCLHISRWSSKPKQTWHEGNLQIFEVFQVFKSPPGNPAYMIVVQESVRRRRRKTMRQTRVYNSDQEFVLAGEGDVKEKESHEVIWRRWSSQRYRILMRFCKSHVVNDSLGLCGM